MEESINKMTENELSNAIKITDLNIKYALLCELSLIRKDIATISIANRNKSDEETRQEIDMVFDNSTKLQENTLSKINDMLNMVHAEATNIYGKEVK